MCDLESESLIRSLIFRLTVETISVSLQTILNTNAKHVSDFAFHFSKHTVASNERLCKVILTILFKEIALNTLEEGFLSVS